MIAKGTPPIDGRMSVPDLEPPSWGYAELCRQVMIPAFMTVALVVYMILSSLVRFGDLHLQAINCCAPQHVVFGALGWYFPPIIILLLLYQVADHYGYWYTGTFGPERESWAATFGDISDYAVGFALVFAVRWMRPLRVGCLRHAWRYYKRTGRCVDAPPCCVSRLCPGCVDPPPDDGLPGKSQVV